MVEVNAVDLRIFSNGDDAERLGMGSYSNSGSITIFVNLFNAEDGKKCTDTGFTVV